MADSTTPAKPPRRRKPSKPDEDASKGEEKEACFVMSPFGSYFDDYHQEIFRPAIIEAGLMPTRADDLFRSSNIVEDIWSMIQESNVLLADLTGRNPNVFYELGLAHAARKPVVLITEVTADVPFDLRYLRYLSYEPRKPGWDKALQQQITKSILETLEAPEHYVLPSFLRASTGPTPSVPEDELRFLRLEQEVNSLRAQLQTLSPASEISFRRRKTVMPESEAIEMLDRLWGEGASQIDIFVAMQQEGVPTSWLRREIERRKAG
jgi:nucleoside 2-deoxyribosyltransferase